MLENPMEKKVSESGSRHNEIRLKGSVIKVDTREIGDNLYEAVVIIGVMRSPRHIGDKSEKARIDQPYIITRDQAKVTEMATWQKNDIVEIYGFVATEVKNKAIPPCPVCGDINHNEGLLTYIEPIFVERTHSEKDVTASIKYLHTIREVSNRATICGRCARDPKKVEVKNGPTVTQYPIAVKRKINVRHHPADKNIDYPWVKSYGVNAENDRDRLKLSSLVLIDGFVQTRTVNKKCVCEKCSTRFEYPERTLEIVPYETEYLSGYYSVEEAAENRLKRREQKMKDLGLSKYLFAKDYDYEEDSDDITQDDIDAGIDPFESDNE